MASDYLFANLTIGDQQMLDTCMTGTFDQMPWCKMPEVGRINYLATPLHSDVTLVMDPIREKVFLAQDFRKLTLHETFLVLITAISTTYKVITDGSLDPDAVVATHDFLQTLSKLLVEGMGKPFCCKCLLCLQSFSHRCVVFKRACRVRIG